MKTAQELIAYHRRQHVMYGFANQTDGPTIHSETADALAASLAREEKLRELVLELADDLAEHVNAAYPPEARAYSSEMRRFNRDMAVVLRARAALAETEVKP